MHVLEGFSNEWPKLKQNKYLRQVSKLREVRRKQREVRNKELREARRKRYR